VLTPTSTINWSYSNGGSIVSTGFNGIITLNGAPYNASSATGTQTSVSILGGTIGGTATGNGSHGAGQSTVSLSGSVQAIPTYVPAFYLQTSNSSVPTFNTSGSQTSGAAQGSSITYTAATAATQYNWICTQRAIGNISIVTPFGTAPLIPDIPPSGQPAPTQTLGGQTFNIYGFTSLTIGVPVQLVIS